MRNLGGEELYGRNATVGLRELIQNSSDAVRARRIAEPRPNDYGQITVRLTKSDDQHWLEVEDNGVGMSARVLTNVLLDFGSSYWGSELVSQELPGVMGSGFTPTGQYGIGFFSVLMLGDEVTVTTRRYDEAPRQARVLVFRHGIDERPLLRPAEERDESLLDGGTRVKILLREPPNSRSGFLRGWGERPWTLAELVEWLAPGLDVDIAVEDGGAVTQAVSASDWLTIAPLDLVMRVCAPSDMGDDAYKNLASLADNIRELRDGLGNTIGRACVVPDLYYRTQLGSDDPGVVTVGGLRATGSAIMAGLICGVVQRAARDFATPLVEPDELARWASEQAVLLSATLTDLELQAECADTITILGGDPGPLAFVESSDGWRTAAQIEQWDNPPDSVIIVDGFDVASERRRGSQVELLDNVVRINRTYRPVVSSGGGLYIDWPDPVLFVDPPQDATNEYWRWARRNSAVGRIVSALGVAWGVDVESILRASTFSEREFIEVAMRDGVSFKDRPEATIRRPSTLSI